jgi:hypothetical protein
MHPPDIEMHNVSDDRIFQLLLHGDVQTLHAAEERYLDSAIPEVLDLLASSRSNEELNRHPLMNMFVAHGSRGWEDSLL